MNKPIDIIQENNLSVAWAKAYSIAMKRPGGEMHHLTVSVNGFNDNKIIEIREIRERLDQELINQGKPSCSTIAGTIFPETLWNPNKDRNFLFKRYEKNWPRIQCYRNNWRGTYFRRLTSYDNPHSSSPINQLDHIIQTWKKGNHRRSALQAAIFDPAKDHSHARQLGFPCLQHVFFSNCDNNGKSGLSITGIYATQYLFEKAYGNYLGLCQLGRFMAKEMGLNLAQMTCITTVAKLGNASKKDLDSLHKSILALSNQ